MSRTGGPARRVISSRLLWELTVKLELPIYAMR